MNLSQDPVHLDCCIHFPLHKWKLVNSYTTKYISNSKSEWNTWIYFYQSPSFVLAQLMQRRKIERVYVAVVVDHLVQNLQLKLFVDHLIKAFLRLKLFRPFSAKLRHTQYAPQVVIPMSNPMELSSAATMVPLSEPILSACRTRKDSFILMGLLCVAGRIEGTQELL